MDADQGQHDKWQKIQNIAHSITGRSASKIYIKTICVSPQIQVADIRIGLSQKSATTANSNTNAPDEQIGLEKLQAVTASSVLLSSLAQQWQSYKKSEEGINEPCRDCVTMMSKAT